MKNRLRILMLNFTVIFIAGSSLGAPGEQMAMLKINKEYDKRTVIKKSLIPNGGNGLFAVVKIKKGEVIGELGGRLVGDNDESLGNHYIASIPKCAWIKAGRRSASSLRYGPGLRVSICAPIRARGHTPPRSLSANESAPFGASP